MKDNLTFEFLESINESKNDIMTEENESLYIPYLINHFMGCSIDTNYYANQMNENSHLPKRLQYDYLRLTVRKKYRRAKWLKRDIKNIKLIQRYFEYSPTKALESLKILSQEDLDKIEQFLEQGGTNTE